MALPSPFALAAPTLVANNYSPIPIRPDGKMPGVLTGDGWRIMREWSRYCQEQPSDFQIRMWSRWAATNIGICCGRGVIAFDIDRDDFVEPIKAVLPPAIVGKRGRKGETLFFRADTNVIRSRGFKIDGFGVMDLIAEGKQTVVPPSIHPDTAEPYRWTTERTLLDTKPAELSYVTAEHFEAVLGVLKAAGWHEEKTYAVPAVGMPGDIDDGAAAASEFFRTLNDDALRNLDAWVPRLGLTILTNRGDGYRSVAEWRPSNSGKPTHKRELHLAIHPKGIVDYGDCEKGYTPLNLVMAAFECSLDRAVTWLGEQLGMDFGPATVLNHKPRPPGHVKPQRPGTTPTKPQQPGWSGERAGGDDGPPPEPGAPWPLPFGLVMRSLEELAWKERAAPRPQSVRAST